MKKTVEIPNPKDLTVEVEQDHIDYGLRADYHFCPIALALARKLQLPTEKIVVCNDAVQIQREDGKYDRYGLCCHGRAFVKKFDAGQEVKPGPVYLFGPRWRDIDDEVPSTESII